MKPQNILQGVPPLRFWGEGAVGWYCLAGAVTRYIEYTGDPVSYEEMMGVSGAAWRLIWNPGQWSPDNLIMAWYGHLLAEKRIADAFGYGYEYLDRRRETPRTGGNSEAAVTARIRAASEIRQRGPYCQGCHGDRTVHWSADCWILKCCVGDKSLSSCHECGGFPCQQLGEWAAQNERYTEAFNRLHRLKEGTTSRPQSTC